MEILTLAARILNFEGVKLKKLYDDFKGSRIKELDFWLELQNGVETCENFKDDDRVYIPKFYTEYSSDRVVTMEFIDHTLRIDDVDKIVDKYGRQQTDQYVSESLIDIFAKQIFLYGHVHVDGHPGNILIRDHPQYKNRPQIVLLDHGHYCRVSDEFRLQFWNLWYSLVTFNEESVK